MLTQRISLLAVATIAAVLSSAYQASAQSYPTRLIKLVVPSPPGGPHEVVVRALADRMSSALGQTVIVENRPGAGGAIGARAVAAAAPDGYTLLVSAPGALVVVPTLQKNAGYDTAKDFVAVATAYSSPQMLVVHPTFAVNSIRDIVAYAKANPGKLNYASPNYGTGPHLLGELFRLITGTDIVNVRYKGGAESVMGMLAGQVHIGFEIVPLLLGHVQAGKLKAIAVADAVRSRQLPNVPTTVESGFPELQATLWVGVMAPVGTPPTIVSKLNATINGIMTSKEMEASLHQLGATPKVGTPQEVAAFVATEQRKWAKVIQDAGISID
jgi:tripartite-type tricarboxylate transporter receptor subunit TctC